MKLDDLPASDNKEFWGDADIHKAEPRNMFDQKHYFERVAGHQAQCNHCFWGFELNAGDQIIDGHLFDKKGKKVL